MNTNAKTLQGINLAILIALLINFAAAVLVVRDARSGAPSTHVTAQARVTEAA